MIWIPTHCIPFLNGNHATFHSKLFWPLAPKRQPSDLMNDMKVYLEIELQVSFIIQCCYFQRGPFHRSHAFFKKPMKCLAGVFVVQVLISARAKVLNIDNRKSVCKQWMMPDLPPNSILHNTNIARMKIFLLSRRWWNTSENWQEIMRNFSDRFEFSFSCKFYSD